MDKFAKDKPYESLDDYTKALAQLIYDIYIEKRENDKIKALKNEGGDV